MKKVILDGKSLYLTTEDYGKNRKARRKRLKNKDRYKVVTR